MLDFHNKTNEQILQEIQNFHPKDQGEHSALVSLVWNYVVGLKANTRFTIDLRLFAIDTVMAGMDENGYDYDHYDLFKLLKMMITTVDCLFKNLEYDECQKVLDKAYTIFLKVKECPETAQVHQFSLNLKFHTCLLQWHLNKNTTCLQLAHTAINDSIDHIGNKEVGKLFKLVVKLADLSHRDQDKDQWFKIFQSLLEKSTIDRKFYARLWLELGILRGQLLLKIKKQDEAELLLGNLMQEYSKAARVYMLNFKLLELKNADTQEWSHLYKVFCDKSDKQEPSVVFSILHLLAQNGLIDEALESLDQLSNIDIANSEQILLQKVHIIMSRKTENDYEQVEQCLRHGELDHSSEISKQIMIILWNRGDFEGSNGEYANAIKWFELARTLLLSNLVDSRNNSKLCRKIAYCQLKLGLTALDTALKSIGLDQRPNSNGYFLMFQIYLQNDDLEQAVNNLKQIDYQQHPEYYLAACDYCYQVGKNEPVTSILKICVNNVKDGLNLGEIKPLVVVLRNLVKIQYDNMPDSEQELLQNVIKAGKLLAILKDKTECEWLFRICYNAGIMASRQAGPLFFEQAINNWKLTGQSGLENIKACLELAITARLNNCYKNKDNLNEELKVVKELLAWFKEPHLNCSDSLKFEIQVLLLDGSYDEAYQLVNDADLSLLSWKQLAHKIIEKLQCPSRIVCKALSKILAMVDDDQQEYSRWSRLCIRAHLESPKPESCLEFVDNLLLMLKANVVMLIDRN